MKTNLSVKINSLLIVLLVAIMACSVFSVVYAESNKSDTSEYIDVAKAEDGEYAIKYDTSGLAQGAKYFYNIAIVEKKGKKYNLTLLQKGSEAKMNEMRIEKPKVIEAEVVPDGDNKVRYIFKDLSKRQFEKKIECSTFVPAMNFRPPFSINIDLTKGEKFDDLDVLLGEAPDPEDAKVVMPMGMIIGIVVMVVVVVAIIAVVVIVIVKKSKKKSAIEAVVEDAKAEEPKAEQFVEETPVEAPAEETPVEEAPVEAEIPAEESAVEETPVEDTEKNEETK